MIRFPRFYASGDEIANAGAARSHNDRVTEGKASMVLIIALVKPFRAQAVLAALEPFDVLAGTVREVMGHGRQKNRLHRYLGSEYNDAFVPKVEIAFFVRRADAPAVVKVVVAQARTGRIGDGKILVLPCYPEFAGWGE